MHDGVLRHLQRIPFEDPQGKIRTCPSSGQYSKLTGFPKLNNKWLTFSTKDAQWMPTTMVGTYPDLDPGRHQVSRKEGRRMAEEFCCAWMEVQMNSRNDVNKAFEMMIMQDQKREKQDLKPRSCTVV